MNILAVAAHPDDLELSCYGTLAKYKKQGHNIFAALTTSGNMGHNGYASAELAAIRRSEQEASAALLGLPIRFLDFSELLVDGPELQTAVMEAVRWARADVILTHWPRDNSADHRITGEAVQEILLYTTWKNFKTGNPPLEKAPAVFYWDTNGGVGFIPEAYVDITGEMPLKREALSKHKSQIALAEDYTRVLEYTAGFRGLQAGYQYAEGFIAHRIFGNIASYKLLP